MPIATGPARATQLKDMLSARTSRDGSPLKGYAKNVVAIREELARLEGVETARAAAGKDLDTPPAAP